METALDTYDVRTHLRYREGQLLVACVGTALQTGLPPPGEPGGGDPYCAIAIP